MSVIADIAGAVVTALNGSQEHLAELRQFTGVLTLIRKVMTAWWAW